MKLDLFQIVVMTRNVIMLSAIDYLIHSEGNFLICERIEKIVGVDRTRMRSFIVFDITLIVFVVVNYANMNEL